MLHDTGLLAKILPEVTAMIGVEQPPEFHPEGDVFTHTRLMLDLLPPVSYTHLFGKLHVINTYVPQGRDIEHEMYAYKLEWLARLKKYFQARFTTATPLFWCGDLNVARHPIDVSNPQTKTNHVCFHQAVRDAFEDVLAFGFTDLFRQHNPDLVDYSFYAVSYTHLDVYKRQV